jgi:hypothetical protein
MSDSEIDDSPGSEMPSSRKRRLAKRKEVLIDHLENRRKKRKRFVQSHLCIDTLTFMLERLPCNHTGSSHGG